MRVEGWKGGRRGRDSDLGWLRGTLVAVVEGYEERLAVGKSQVGRKEERVDDW